MPLRTLDLFSGIGGFALGLKSVCKTVAYCDISQDSHNVLQSQIKQGLLHKAPIFNDIKSIGAKELVSLKPQMITGGFPCTDISSANPDGAGVVGGKRSGLFREIIRIIDQCPSIQVALLENSPRIKDKGLHYVLQAFKKRGFTCRYGYFEALDVGSYHKRKRWYGLFYKQGVVLPKLHINNTLGKNWCDPFWDKDFNDARCIRVTRSQRDVARRRCGLLGNSVVPQIVKLAWSCLRVQKTIYQEYDFVHRPHLKIQLDDGEKKYTRKYWATPTYTTWHNYKSITKRGITLLSNQTFFYIGTKTHAPKNVCGREYVANPLFVEWLMGYPANWTKTQ